MRIAFRRLSTFSPIRMPHIDSSFLLNHTCLRIKDPKVSVPFYTKHFGMNLVKKLDNPDSKFTLYMLAIEAGDNKGKPWTERDGVLELCHNYGTENDDNFSVNNGNGSEHRGFGHICFSVDNLEATEQELLDNDVKFQKKTADGRQKNIAFALDPDGYWIELIENGTNKKPDSTDKSTYKLNHTMVRVKDAQKSLDFYTKVLGMDLISTSVHEGAKFTLYFLAYTKDSNFKQNLEERSQQVLRQGILELTHNWGTETDDSFQGYHNGNSTENGAKTGYGHIAITCDDAAKFCSEIEEALGGNDEQWQVKFNQGRMKNLAFIRDPDNYWIEILPSKF